MSQVVAFQPNPIVLAATQPPHNIQAEQALLGAVLVRNDGFHTVADRLRVEHFFEPVHGRIWDTMARLIRAGKVADSVTLKAEFDLDESLREINGASYLAAMARAAETILNVPDYADLVIELAGRRRVAELAGQASAAASDLADNRPLAQQIETLRSELERIARDHEQVPPWHSLGEVVGRIIDRLESPAERWSTGLRHLDSSLAGGIAPGEIYGFEARMKMGKSLTLGTLMLSLIKQGVPTLMVALEMGSARIVERMIGAETRCNAIRFRKHQDPQDLISRCQRFVYAHGRCPGYIADEPGCSFERLQAVATNAVVKLGMRVLIVDYWQLVTGQRKGQSSAEHMGEVAQWLAAFAGKHGVSVLIASQTNRDGAGYGSDGLAKACDWLGRLHKVEAHSLSLGDFEGIWIEVALCRDGVGATLGSAEAPAFRIDKRGPVLVDHGG